MCMFNMRQKDDKGEGWIKKPTGFMSNSKRTLQRLSCKCKNMHRHIQLIGGRAKLAEVYPDEVCAQVIKGLAEQMRDDHRIEDGAYGVTSKTDESVNMSNMNLGPINGIGSLGPSINSISCHIQQPSLLWHRFGTASTGCPRDSCVCGRPPRTDS